MNHSKIKKLSYRKVKLNDTFLQRSFALESDYLLSLDPMRLIVGFQETAGRKHKAIRYPGWEETEIQGHTLGHYLTAMAQAYAATGEERYRGPLDAVMEELARCQREDGYLFASPETLFDRVEHRQPAWVPWYTMHKLLSGILHVVRYTGSETAGRILQRLADWVAQRALSWDEETKRTVLAVEYGGMNDCMYEVYALTGEERYAQAAHQFDEMPLFEAMEQKRDILNGLHANTTIPKILGGLKRYVVTGEKDPFYLRMAENFWDMVVEHHTYITGGNSEWEHFGNPDILDAERTACTCETCNTYNMLKLSSLLFTLTGNKKYADYDEQTYVNAILSSQNHETGMTTYFQPMATGYFKVYSTPYDKFWCCTGTGMENFTKQCENIYYASPDRLWINRYVDSEVNWEEGGLALRVEADLLHEKPVKVTVTAAAIPGICRKLALRKPHWLAKDCRVQMPEGCSAAEEDGYLVFEKQWEEGDWIEVELPMALQVHGLPDSSRTAAFTYGPYVLSADLGTEDMRTTVTGVDVTVPTRDITVQECILLPPDHYARWREELPGRFEKIPGEIAFTLDAGAGQRLRFAPHYLKDQVRYGIYFMVFAQDSREYRAYLEEEKRKKELFDSTVDVIPVGNDQYELAHFIRGYKTDSTSVDGKRGRFAEADGWFSYEMQFPRERAVLCVTYRVQDKSCVELSLNGELLAEETVCFDQTEGFAEKVYELPEKFAGERVRVQFKNGAKDGACRIFGEVYIRVK